MSETNLRCFVIMPFSKSSEIHTEGYWTTPLAFDVSSKATLFYNPNNHLKME
jgi:hypothetical protein